MPEIMLFLSGVAAGVLAAAIWMSVCVWLMRDDDRVTFFWWPGRRI